MFDVSFGELLVAAIVALLVIGPKDLPDAVRKAGQYWGQFKRLLTDARSQWNDVLHQSGAADVQHDMERIHQAMEPVHRALAQVREQPLEVFLNASTPASQVSPSALAPVNTAVSETKGESSQPKTTQVRAKSKAAKPAQKRVKKASSDE